MPTCIQINLQQHFGGGEVYTRFLSEALISQGWEVELYAHRAADFWHHLDLKGTRIHFVGDASEVPGRIGDTTDARLLITHGHPPKAIHEALQRRGPLCAIAHMPVHNRSVEGFAGLHRVFGVSRYVIDTLNQKQVSRVHPEPLYGVADLRGGQPTDNLPLVRASRYDWDLRKGRDRLLSWLYPLYQALRPQVGYETRPGITLGIVSRITTIKQFDKLFTLLAPIIADFPQLHLEIFGAGGYASVRDLRRALKPIAAQTRWWGHQQQVAAVYPRLDYLMTGLPEREALGLNVLEAEACGTPILAVDGGPFRETVVHGQSGWLYTDPREDAGKDFKALISQLTRPTERLDPRTAREHLERFSMGTFAQRVDRIFRQTMAQA
ncbi:MAG: glycosyltransferase family 4 protein [Candidatus Thiodiazotropha sp.]